MLWLVVLALGLFRVFSNACGGSRRQLTSPSAIPIAGQSVIVPLGIGRASEALRTTKHREPRWLRDTTITQYVRSDKTTENFVSSQNWKRELALEFQ